MRARTYFFVVLGLVSTVAYGDDGDPNAAQERTANMSFSGSHDSSKDQSCDDSVKNDVADIDGTLSLNEALLSNANRFLINWNKNHSDTYPSSDTVSVTYKEITDPLTDPGLDQYLSDVPGASSKFADLSAQKLIELRKRLSGFFSEAKEKVDHENPVSGDLITKALSKGDQESLQRLLALVAARKQLLETQSKLMGMIKQKFVTTDCPSLLPTARGPQWIEGHKPTLKAKSFVQGSFKYPGFLSLFKGKDYDSKPGSFQLYRYGAGHSDHLHPMTSESISETATGDLNQDVKHLLWDTVQIPDMTMIDKKGQAVGPADQGSYSVDPAIKRFQFKGEVVSAQLIRFREKSFAQEPYTYDTLALVFEYHNRRYIISYRSYENGGHGPNEGQLAKGKKILLSYQ